MRPSFASRAPRKICCVSTTCSKQIDAQIDSLKRQARQAQRYKGLAAEIRRNEALPCISAWRDGETALAEAERRLESRYCAKSPSARAFRRRPRARRRSPRRRWRPLRDEEARAGAALHRLVVAREALEGEERRAKERTSELERRIGQLASDLDPRDRADRRRGGRFRAGWRPRSRALAAQSGAQRGSDRRGAGAPRRRRTRAARREARLAEAQAALSDLNARRNALVRRFGRGNSPPRALCRGMRQDRRASARACRARLATRPRYDAQAQSAGGAERRRCGRPRRRRSRPKPPMRGRARPRRAPAARSARPNARRSGSRRKCAR